MIVEKIFYTGVKSKMRVTALPELNTDVWRIKSVTSDSLIISDVANKSFNVTCNAYEDFMGDITLTVEYTDNHTPHYISERSITFTFKGLHREVEQANFSIVNNGTGSLNVTWECETPIHTFNVDYAIGDISDDVEYVNRGLNYTNTTTFSDVISIPAGKALYLHSDVMEQWGDKEQSSSYRFKITGHSDLSLAGDILSLIRNKKMTKDYTFANLFQSLNCITVPKMPRNLSVGCFQYMFRYATIQTLPDDMLPATSLPPHAYQGMFRDANISKMPILYATNVGEESCREMFYMSEVQDVSNEIHFYNIEALGCFEMFFCCNNITTPPDISGIKFVTTESLLGMFRGCGNLVSDAIFASDITIYGSRSFQQMYNDCRSLTTVHKFEFNSKLTESCCYQMYMGCSNLVNVPEDMLTNPEWGEFAFGDMFINCTSLQNTPKFTHTTIPTGLCMSMFIGCTSLTSIPELPADYVPDYAYVNMFQRCTGITSAVLPATTVANENSYAGIFDGCTNLSYVKMMSLTGAGGSGTLNFGNWLNDVASTGTFVMNPNATYDVDASRGKNGIPEGWTVVTAIE